MLKSIAGRMLLGAAGIASASWVNAQTPGGDQSGRPTGPSSELQKVVVTAEYRKERLQDAPIAITALDSNALSRVATTDLTGAANLAPNVALTPSANFGQMASIFIRGVGQSDPHFAVEPGVGMYVDDVYYGVMPGALFQLLDLDRVEILRGPQGTLAGKNSIGGSIKVYSKQPGADTDGYAEVEYGSYNRVGGRAAANISLIGNDTLIGRVAVSAVRSDGYMDRLDYGCVTGAVPTLRIGSGCQLGTQGGQNTVTARATLLWSVNDTTRNTLIVDAIHDNSENPATKQLYASPLWAGSANYVTCPTCYTNYETYISRPAGGPASGQTYVMPATTPLQAWGVSNHFHVELTSWMRLDSITAERQSRVTFSTPADATPASVNDGIWTEVHRQFTQELRLSGELGNLVDWTVGGFYYDAPGTSSGRQNIAFGLSPGGGDGGLGIADDIVFSDPVTAINKSAFVHTTTHVSERLALTLDARYSRDAKEFTFNHWNALGQPDPKLPGLQSLLVSAHDSRVDYRAGIDYKWTNDLMSYAQVATGYKGGGVSPRPFFSSQARPFAPETLTAYELGTKSQFFDHRLTFNLAGFFDTYGNFQGVLGHCDAYSPFPGAPCALTTNVGSAHIGGMEVESALHLAGGLSVDASFGWLKFKFVSVQPLTGIQLSDTNVQTPDVTANLGAQYSFNIGAAGTLIPRLDYSYRGAMYTDFLEIPGNRVSSLGLLNGRLSWIAKDDAWEAAFIVTNLLNKFYYNGVGTLDAPPPALQLFGSGTGVLGPPREFLFTLRRRF